MKYLSFRRHSWVFASIFLVYAVIFPLGAVEPLPKPQGETILTVTGNIAVANAENAARFDRAMLKAFPQTSVVSYTDWTDGKQEFSGVLLEVLLERLGAEGESIVARALNDYEAVLPMDDLERHQVLLALNRNGEAMPVRDKGPIWIIYPNDQPVGGAPFPHNDKMVWQLMSLDVQ